ncbi:MAG: hypothetical protein QOJ52_1981 [Acidimicrobiaceae bacterium]|jgi:uncharacterized protein (DUF427 family)|nr:hypothetical protein [Acidimicrobiaceae bacterium]MDQ1365848.1 hypothetical protein [Acidimicrobiaceae bacterium]MDQ1378959.1 hypothetical protein [Acidimicrobiaceae bacterium]MDQ1399031.1 hypothetical protein [Acidimicrobiaceae bacterium]MDQ1412868.1 hypothetical protein [Acidimicrobiaceae bacterium]
MMRAIWNGATIAESDDTVQVEGNHYFPLGAVAEGYLQESDTHTVCSWKGTASYFDVVVGGQTNPDAAWYYPDPMAGAESVAGRVAFWHGVQVEATAGASQ